MLFNSYVFIFLFLPVTLAVFFALGRLSHALGAAWLTAASLFFYGWWNPAFVGLLLASILFNYRMGLALAQAPPREPGTKRKRLLIIAVAANLLVLGYFKYAELLLSSQRANTVRIAVSGIWMLHIAAARHLVLHLYADRLPGRRVSGQSTRAQFVHYVLFVTYFPHLIAGPVLHHKRDDAAVCAGRPLTGLIGTISSSG